MNTDLTKPEKLPEEFTSRLQQIRKFCFDYQLSEELVDHMDVSLLVRDIDTYCITQSIIGIHYTRAIPESVRTKGLLIRSGEEIRTEFLNDHGHLFTESEVDTIKESWSNYFTTNQSSVRDGRIFFNFTETALSSGGAEYLLGLYGGEQVSMCFELNSTLGKKLGSIGVPLIVRCALNPNNVHTFTEHPWGKILVSSYHLSVNPEAHGIDQDGYQSVPVMSENIVEIKALTNR